MIALTNFTEDFRELNTLNRLEILLLTIYNMLGFDYIKEGQTNRFWFKLPSFLPKFNETLNTKIISITFFRQNG